MWIALYARLALQIILPLMLSLFVPRLQAQVLVAGNDEGPLPRQPQVAIDGAGTVFVTYGRGEQIFVTHSRDQGQSFSRASKVGELPKLALGMRRGPRIAANQDSILVAAISHETGNLFAWKSSDRGKTWSPAMEVNDVKRSAREGLHDLAVGPDGTMHLTWLDLRSGKMEIYTSHLGPKDSAWSENTRVYTSPSGSVCECCHPSIEVDTEGRIVIMWRNSIDGYRDMYLATSTDGKTFEPAQKLGQTDWLLNACPMDGGAVTIDTEGVIHTIWRRKNGVYATASNDPSEEPLGIGEQPWIAATEKGVWKTWLRRRNGELVLLKPDTETEIKLADAANDPILATGGEPQFIIAAWEERVGDQVRIVAKKLNP